MQEQQKDMCCPPFSPELWDNKEIVWQDKLFITDNVSCLFHIPLNIGKVIGRMWKKVNEAQAFDGMDGWILLSYDPSPWKTEQYMSVTKEISNANNLKMSGKFLTKVFEGSYNMAPKWLEEFSAILKDKNIVAKKYYFYYTTCPKCAKKYGKNYVVIFAQIE